MEDFTKKKMNLASLRTCFMALGFLSFFITVFFALRFIVAAKDTQIELHAPVEVSHRVLFISSNTSLYFTYDSQVSGLQKSLYPNGVEYDVLFMDGNSRGSSTFEMFADYFRARFDSLYRYEAVLVGGDVALRFVMEYQDEIFARMPIIFFCIADYNLACRAAENPYMCGFYENDYLKETIDLATKLFPKRKTLIALHDQTFAGSNDGKIFWSLRDKYPGYIFSELDTSLLSQMDLISLLEEIPPDALLFYLTCYTDKDGNTYSMLSRTSTVVRSSRVPIFRNYVGGEDMGILAGVHMDIENQCMMAGDMVVAILQGKEISMMPLVEQTPSRTSFDYTLGKHYGLDFRLLPENTVFYNRPDTFLNHYGKILPIGIMSFVTMLFLIAYLRAGKLIANAYVRELKASTERLEESQELLVYQAEHDEVLDILNRRTITDWIRSSMTERSVYSVVIIDIDDFKMLNENYGHSMADSILQYLVALLKGLVDEGGWKLARFGGDELIMVIPDESIEMESPVVRQLFSIIRAPIPLGDE
ncbi:MAG: diguanylate cyclase, partial [Treponema sp.]|nr:diguanylate cyclase [Treponema sp.]